MVIPKIDKSLLFIEKLTEDPQVSLKFKGPNCTISRNGHVIARGTRGSDNLYRTGRDEHQSNVLKTTEINIELKYTQSEESESDSEN